MKESRNGNQEVKTTSFKETISFKESVDELVFVYGSLKKGYSNHLLLSSSELVGPAQTVEGYSLVSLGTFPGVFLSPNNSKIKGEVYKVSPETFKELDILEGFPDFYYRALIDVTVQIDDKLQTITTWMYYLTDMDTLDFKPIPSGLWKEEDHLLFR